MNNKLVSLINLLKLKSIESNPSIIENILGIPVKVKDFSGIWKEEGIFVKENEEYTFLSRHYFEQDKDGRGNIIFARDITLDDTLTKEDESSYIIRFKNGGGASIYDEEDLNLDPEKDIFGLKESFMIYNQLLILSGIPPMRKVN